MAPQASLALRMSWGPPLSSGMGPGEGIGCGPSPPTRYNITPHRLTPPHKG